MKHRWTKRFARYGSLDGANGFIGSSSYYDHEEYRRPLAPEYQLAKARDVCLPPDEIIHRPKAPFGAPLRSWVKKDLDPLIQDLLSEERIKKRGYLNHTFVKRLIADDKAGRHDNAHRIWALLTLEVWFQVFVDGAAPVQRPGCS